MDNFNEEKLPFSDESSHFQEKPRNYSCLYRFPGVPLNYLNPGSISNLHKKVRDLTPEWIEGCSLRFAKNLDVNSTFYGEWMMGNNTPVGFRFGGMLCRKNSESYTKTPVLIGDTNPSTLATNLHFLYHPIPKIKIETKLQTDAFPYTSGFRHSIGLLEYLGKNSTVSLTIYNPYRESGRVTIGVLQNISKNFCAGVELLTVWSNKSEIENSLAFAGRYSFKKSFVATTVSKDAFDISFWHQPMHLLQFGASFIYNKRISKAIGSLCYQLEMKDAVLKGMMDTNWSIGCTYTRQLKELSSAFGFSILFCIPTNKFYCGLKYELNSNLQ